jgi:hypothetical protein
MHGNPFKLKLSDNIPNSREASALLTTWLCNANPWRNFTGVYLLSESFL